jgi:hypothetical protein
MSRYVVDTARAVSPAAIAFVALLSVGMSGALGAGLSPLVNSAGSAGPIASPSPSVTATLQNGSYLGTHASAQFYAVVFSDVQTPTRELVKIGAFLNTTPVSEIRFGGSGDGYDPTTQTLYHPPRSGQGRYVATHEVLWNLAWFKSWCRSTTPHCVWLSYLPGEENDTRAAIHTARWFHQVLGFAPTFWEFGNEPTLWTHYGKNISTWSTSDNRAVTAADYSVMVRNYIAAVSALYPGDQYVGVESACACNGLLAGASANAASAHFAAIAYHSYPSSSTSSRQVGAFYGLLSSTADILSSAARFRQNIVASCSGCASVPVELGEYQAGPYYAFSPLAGTYSGAPFLAVSAIQAIQANLAAFTVYNTDALFDGSTGTPTFEGLLYQRILNNLTMGKDYSVTVKGTTVSGVYSLLVKNGSREALLVINTNLRSGLTLQVASVFPSGVAGETWIWAPGSAAPSHAVQRSLASSYTIGVQGILLVANY